MKEGKVGEGEYEGGLRRKQGDHSTRGLFFFGALLDWQREES